MNDTAASLRKKINVAGDLQSVVRTMKAAAASNIGKYEKSVRALDDYFHIAEMGLGVCFRELKFIPLNPQPTAQKSSNPFNVVIFGSDLGLVGQFNDDIVDYAKKTIKDFPVKPRVWAVGERVHARMQNAGIALKELFAVPTSVKSITPLVGQILVNSKYRQYSGTTELHLFYNRLSASSIYVPVGLRLLPMDKKWRHTLSDHPWPAKKIPEVMAIFTTVAES